MLLSIDPGASTGWALFIFGGRLVSCGLTTPATWGNLVAQLTHGLGEAGPGPAPDVLVEKPTLYPHSKARPADIMALQLKVGELKGRFESVGCKVELVQPRTWKHSVPKAVHNARVLKRLTDAERALVEGKRHDVIDAVGLGLWKLGRMK